MNSDQFERYLKRQGIKIRKKKGTSHRIATNPANGKFTEITRHGGSQQLGIELRNKILKDLGLK